MNLRPGQFDTMNSSLPPTNPHKILLRLSEAADTQRLMLADVELGNQLLTGIQSCIEAYRNNKKVLIAGNGGSAADAQHLAGELVSQFYFDRPALAAVALTTDTSVLTAVSNDYGYENVFSRQIVAHGIAGDVFIAISTSGNSPSILKALQQARVLGLRTIGLTGRTGGEMKSLCDICLCAPSDSTPRIQECHLVLEHTLCACIEEALFGHQRSS
jgi:D-sedoheptulose 7-phosphate isomerase